MRCYIQPQNHEQNYVYSHVSINQIVDTKDVKMFQKK